MCGSRFPTLSWCASSLRGLPSAVIYPFPLRVRGIKSSDYFCCAKIFQVPFSLIPGEAVRQQPFNDGKLYLLRITLTALHNQYTWVAFIDQPPALWLYTRRNHALYTRILSYPTSCVDRAWAISSSATACRPVAECTSSKGTRRDENQWEWIGSRELSTVPGLFYSATMLGSLTCNLPTPNEVEGEQYCRHQYLTVKTFWFLLYYLI